MPGGRGAGFRQKGRGGSGADPRTRRAAANEIPRGSYEEYKIDGRLTAKTIEATHRWNTKTGDSPYDLIWANNPLGTDQTIFVVQGKYSGSPDFEWHTQIIVNDCETPFEQLFHLSYDRAQFHMPVAIGENLTDYYEPKGLLDLEENLVFREHANATSMSAVANAVNIWAQDVSGEAFLWAYIGTNKVALGRETGKGYNYRYVEAVASTPITLSVDDDDILLVDATAADVYVNLPPANIATPLHKEFTIKKIDASSNKVYVQVTGFAEDVEDNPTWTLADQYEVVSVCSMPSGGGWYVTDYWSAAYAYDAGGGTLILNNDIDLLLQADNQRIIFGATGDNEMSHDGTGLLLTGRMGIGATTTASSLYVYPGVLPKTTYNAVNIQAADWLVSSNSTTYSTALVAACSQAYNVAAGVTDSGYRVAMNVQGHCADASMLGTISQQYGMLLYTGASAGSGTITNAYGVYISTLTGGATVTNQWGIYQADASVTKNYFGGITGFNYAPTPTIPVQVRATAAGTSPLRLLKNTAAALMTFSQTAGNEGSIFMYNASAAVAIALYTGATSYVSQDFQVKADNYGFVLGAAGDARMDYDGTDMRIETDLIAPSDLKIKCGSDKTLILEDTVEEDEKLPGLISKAFGLKDPTIAKWLDDGSGSQGIYLPWFSDATEEELLVEFQLSHGYKPGTDLKPHVHFVVEATGGAGEFPVWGLEYVVKEIDGTFAANTTIILGDASSAATATTSGDGTLVVRKHYLQALPTISGTGLSESACLVGRLFRLPTDANDTLGERCGLLSSDCHFEKEKLGKNR
jgi:hypothetical protein